MLTLATSENALTGFFKTGSGDVIAFLLLALVALVLVLGVACVLLVQRWSPSHHRGQRKGHLSHTSDHRLSHPLAFEAPKNWIAIRGLNPQVVQRALGLHNPVPCSWEGGLSRTQDHKVFVSPPVSGWILAMGHGLPDPGDDVDDCFRFLLELSRRLGEVQFFSVNRAVNHHAWVKTSHGRVLRAYAWAGKTVWNQGELTPGEVELGLRCFGYCETQSSAPSILDCCRLNTEKVLYLAARWSLDPTMIEADALHETLGVAGDLLPSKAS